MHAQSELVGFTLQNCCIIPSQFPDYKNWSSMIEPAVFVGPQYKPHNVEFVFAVVCP